MKVSTSPDCKSALPDAGEHGAAPGARKLADGPVH